MSGKLRTASRVMRRSGLKGVATRALRIANRRLDVSSWDFPLLPGDISDSSRLNLAVPAAPPPPGRKLRIGWITTPPSIGSGGHTTMFRMVEALEAAGHSCVLLLYDRFGGDLARHGRVIRQGWPAVRADIEEVGATLPHLDGIVATSWQTAHVLAARPHPPCRRFYFVQDYEPYFYPRGSEYALAEDTYRFGFTCIAVGHMVADLLRREAGLTPVLAEFGCDTDVYRMKNFGHRSGVVFYVKPSVPRRGARLAVLALEEFKLRHPDQPIRLFGDVPSDLPFVFENCGRMTPRELNDLYNRSIAGLVMSFTNISLVPEEMLAAGAIPVVNDSPPARADLDHPSVRWALPTPGALAEALCGAVEAPDLVAQARSAASGVRKQRWEAAQAVFLSTLEAEIYGLQPPRGGTPGAT